MPSFIKRTRNRRLSAGLLMGLLVVTVPSVSRAQPGLRLDMEKGVRRSQFGLFTGVGSANGINGRLWEFLNGVRLRYHFDQLPIFVEGAGFLITEGQSGRTVPGGLVGAGLATTLRAYPIRREGRLWVPTWFHFALGFQVQGAHHGRQTRAFKPRYGGEQWNNHLLETDYRVGLSLAHALPDQPGLQGNAASVGGTLDLIGRAGLFGASARLAVTHLLPVDEWPRATHIGTTFNLALMLYDKTFFVGTSIAYIVGQEETENSTGVALRGGFTVVFDATHELLITLSIPVYPKPAAGAAALLVEYRVFWGGETLD